jgi:hypothetical protein
VISIFFFGLLFSFLGYTPPSVLNITGLKIKLQGNKKKFNHFIIGVLVIVFFQAYVAVYLTVYISNNRILIGFLEKTAIIVLLFLSIYFYHLSRKEKREVPINQKNKNSFLTGILLSTLNMFAIPFFCGIVAFLSSYNLIDFNYTSIFLFISGSVIGTFYILFLYGKYAEIIQKKTGNMTQNINLILSCITGLFALFTFLKFVV